MRLNAALGSIATLVLAIGVASCDGGATEPSFDTTVDSATMSALASRSLQTAYFNFINPAASGSSVGPVLYWGASFGRWDWPGLKHQCNAEVAGAASNGWWTDGNSNLIPDHIRVKFGSSCLVVQEGIGPLGYEHGGYGIDDISPAGGWGWQTIAENWGGACVPQGCRNFGGWNVDGGESLVVTSGGFSHFLDFTYDYTPALGQRTILRRQRIMQTDTFTPDSGTVIHPFTFPLPFGSVAVLAEYRWLGTQFPGAATGSYRVVLSTPTPIHLAAHFPTCPYGADAGVLEGHLDGDPTRGFRWTWSGCGAPTLELFGVTP